MVQGTMILSSNTDIHADICRPCKELPKINIKSALQIFGLE